MLLKDKVIIVSGIGPGLGVKLAIEAAREGAKALAISARTAEKLDEAEQRVREVNAGCKLLKMVTDIRDPAQCARLAQGTQQQFGRIDGLANSAFTWGSPGPADTSDLKGWRDMFETNVLGTMAMTQAVVPIMKAQQGGAIVNITSMATVKPHTGEAGYAASKGALNVATKYLAAELGPSNIRVNLARMGWMLGVPVQNYISYAAKQQGVPEKQLYDAVAANIALRRLTTDTECARVALFLLSDYSSAVTGAVIDANGGETFPS
ncbi:MAG TPA: SDR family oxidoreductase [Steroidobacteraceae bacterium]|jgi:NAD(P)-dependent dehydrogenase (short-subunit alcohol dehydrogenase family)|nr:SDR family oxidoreductase [Steroidobacteraceae bacterium]